MGIQINGNTNNINAGIGSLSIEDINELDIVGVATAANFKTGVSNLHSVGLTLTGGQIDVGSNIKIGTAGVVTATSFVGSGANLTGLSGVSVVNQSNNRLITATGTTDALNGEAQLTFDGNKLITQQTNSDIGLLVQNTTHDSQLRIEAVAANKNSVIMFADGSDGDVGMIDYDHNDNSMSFTTNTNERFRISSTGNITIGTAAAAGGKLYFESTSGAAQYVASGGTNNRDLLIGSSSGTWLSITSAGKLGVGELSPSNALHISGTTGTSAGGLLRLDATTGDNFILYDNTHDNSEWAVGNDSSTRGNFDFWYNSGGGYPSNPIVRFNTTGITVQGNTVADDNNLTAISKTASSDTYSDIFVYDTRKDSDGGAWRHRTNNTSWYNETLNTSIRGSRKEFPQVAIVAVGNAFIHIFDADDPDMPMWMKFPAPSGGARNVIYGTGFPRKVYMLNGILATGSQSTSHWPILIDFIRDDILGLMNVTGHQHYNGRQGHISLRNSATSDSGLWWPGTITGGANAGAYYTKRWWFDGLLVNRHVTSVVMDVRPEAPIDKTTGMQIPTIYLGTRGGVSIIKSNVGDTGTSYHSGVYDITSNNGAYSAIGDITITDDGYLWSLHDYYTADSSNYHVYFRDSSAIDLKRLDNQMNDIVTRPDNDEMVSGFNNQGGGSANKGREYYWPSTGAEGGTHKIGYTNSWAANIVERDAWGCAEGLAFVKRSIYTYDHKEYGSFLVRSHQNRGLVAMITKDYNTGWHMTGNEISVAYIADGLTSSISGADAMIDRGHHARQLGVTGTLTRAACATGSDLSCVSGFSSSNHARIINASLNAGNPSDVTMMGWIKITDLGGYSYLCSMATGSDGMGIAVHNTNSTYGGKPYFYDNQQSTLIHDKSINDGEWHHVCGVRSCNANRKLIYVDGVRGSSVQYPPNADYSDVDTIAVGHWCGTNGTDISHTCRGSLALVKIGLTDLTDQQIKKIYEDEKKLFQPNAKAFLYGSSNAITAIGYDEKKEIYHVGTSSGRSDFSGLSRINNTTTAVTTAISAYDGLIAEQ